MCRLHVPKRQRRVSARCGQRCALWPCLPPRTLPYCHLLWPLLVFSCRTNTGSLQWIFACTDQVFRLRSPKRQRMVSARGSQRCALRPGGPTHSSLPCIFNLRPRPASYNFLISTVRIEPPFGNRPHLKLTKLRTVRSEREYDMVKSHYC
jgi:hypothetical protein